MDLFLSMVRLPEQIEETDYRIDPEAYAQALQKNWPSVTIIVPPLSTYVLRWYMQGDFGISGGLQGDRQTVTPEGNLESLFAFILWHRSVVPENIRLYLFEPNLIMNEEISAQTTEFDILAMFERYWDQING